MLAIILATHAFAQQGVTSARLQRSSSTIFATAAPGLPTALAKASWLAETMPAAEVGATGDAGGDALMGDVLEWLQKMLLGLELNEGDEQAELDELDDDFVAIARPWLHTKGFHVCGAATGLELATQVWSHVSAADYLQSGGSGGGLLLLLPGFTADRALFDRVLASVAEAASQSLGEGVKVSGGHPSSGVSSLRPPAPLLQIFLDSPDLLVDGSLSDAAALL